MSERKNGDLFRLESVVSEISSSLNLDGASHEDIWNEFEKHVNPFIREEIAVN